jgi:DNA-binding XRE family transcriptional regulator
MHVREDSGLTCRHAAVHIGVMPTSSQFAGLARSWRPSGLTQAEASRQIGIDQSTLNKIESGERGSATWVLERMRAAYGLSPADVAAGVSALAADHEARRADGEL